MFESLCQDYKRETLTRLRVGSTPTGGTTYGGVAELEHALDLKSGVERHCGFESHLPY